MHKREATPPGEKAAPEDGTELTADVNAPGGVMTDEAGVITGELTLRTELTERQVTLHVQYKEADEWYRVTGGTFTLADPADLEVVHTLVQALLHRPE